MDIKQKIQNLLSLHAQKLRFLIVGSINTVFGIGLFPVFYYLMNENREHYILILSLTHFIALNFSFFTNKFFVFRTRGNYLREYPKFFAYQLFILIAYLGPFAALVEIGHLHPIVSQLTLSTTVFVISYFWYSKITFLKK